MILFIVLNHLYKKKYMISGYCASLFLVLYGFLELL